MRTLSDARRFLDKTRINPETHCWEWTGAVVAQGYGRFWNGSEVRQAHRMVYEWAKGPIPDGLVLDHLCRVRHCVNPSHLEAVTNGVNLHRGVGPTATNAAKTHCKRGHEFTPANTFIPPGAWRRCRTCHADRERARRRGELLL